MLSPLAGPSSQSAALRLLAEVMLYHAETAKIIKAITWQHVSELQGAFPSTTAEHKMAESLLKLRETGNKQIAIITRSGTKEELEVALVAGQDQALPLDPTLSDVRHSILSVLLRMQEQDEQKKHEGDLRNKEMKYLEDLEIEAQLLREVTNRIP